MKIGYTRVSTSQQQDSLKVQEQALKSYGCEKIFTDQISGVRTDRPGLEAALAYARENDSIVVTRLDRLGRSTVDVLRTVQELASRGITIEALDTKLDTRTPAGKLVLSVLASMAELAGLLALVEHIHQALIISLRVALVKGSWREASFLIMICTGFSSVVLPKS